MALAGCLQGKKAGEFPKHEFSVLSRKKQLGLPFVPTPDRDFLPDTPPRLLQAEHGQLMPIVAGFTTSEGSDILLFAAPRFNLENSSNIGWEELLYVVRLIAPGAPEEAAQAMAQRYSQEAEVARREVEAGSAVYTYHFAHRTSSLTIPEWTGVPPGSELPYPFRTPASVVGANHTEAEVLLSHKVMQYAEVFDSAGKPMVGEGSGKQWPTYDPAKENFERISLKPPKPEKALPASRCEFLASMLSEKPKVPGEQTCPAWGAVNEELSNYNPLMGGTLHADQRIQFLLVPANSLTRILLMNQLGIHGLTLPLQFLHPQCIKAYSVWRQSPCV
ncbi:unnamed protein product [Lepidochelys kempii]